MLYILTALILNSPSALAINSNCSAAIQCRFGVATCSTQWSADTFCGLEKPADKWLICQDRYFGDNKINRRYICCTSAGSAKAMTHEDFQKEAGQCASYGLNNR